jgi:hypothetical protein
MLEYNTDAWQITVHQVVVHEKNGKYFCIMDKTVKFEKLVNAVRIKIDFIYREKRDTYNGFCVLTNDDTIKYNTLL